MSKPVPITEDELTELITRSGPARQAVPLLWGIGRMAIDVESGEATWALQQLHDMRGIAVD